MVTAMSQPDPLFHDGSAYEWQMGRWSRRAGATFIEWLNLPTGLRWLDVGCGNGAFTEELIGRCTPAAVAAIDPSEGQIAYARTRTGAAVADFRTGDAQALPFADNNFDVAVMALAISFVPDPAKAVAEMARVVKPGGWVATYMWDTLNGGAPGDPIYAGAEAIGLTRPHLPSAKASQQDTMRELWQTAGLRSVETRMIRTPVEYADFDEFWDSNTVPGGVPGRFVRSLTPDVLQRLRDHVGAKLGVSAGGRVAYESHANAVKGIVPH